jgi:hypothetical protein
VTILFFFLISMMIREGKSHPFTAPSNHQRQMFEYLEIEFDQLAVNRSGSSGENSKAQRTTCCQWRSPFAESGQSTLQ